MLARRVEIEADLHFRALGIVFGLATRPLNRSFEGAQTAHLVHKTFGVDLRL